MRNLLSTAVVLADGVATTYRRAGSGRTVLLLGASEALALALSESFRVIAPEVPVGLSERDAARWLSGVCEGLGIPEAVIVAGPALYAAATAFALKAPDRVRAVAVADPATADVAGLRAAVARAFG